MRLELLNENGRLVVAIRITTDQYGELLDYVKRHEATRLQRTFTGMPNSERLKYVMCFASTHCTENVWDISQIIRSLEFASPTISDTILRFVRLGCRRVPGGVELEDTVDAFTVDATGKVIENDR